MPRVARAGLRSSAVAAPPQKSPRTAIVEVEEGTSAKARAQIAVERELSGLRQSVRRIEKPQGAPRNPRTMISNPTVQRKQARSERRRRGKPLPHDTRMLLNVLDRRGGEDYEEEEE